MNDLRKAAEMALERLESHDYWADEEAIQALRQALAHPEQEPFEYWNAVEGWVSVDREEVFDGRAKQKMMQAAMKQTSQQYRDDPEVMFAMGWEAGFHSRTTGPKREWVGLKDEQVEDEWERITGHSIFGGARSEGRAMYISPDEVIEFSRAIEAKLKEKNNG